MRRYLDSMIVERNIGRGLCTQSVELGIGELYHLRF